MASTMKQIILFSLTDVLGEQPSLHIIVHGPSKQSEGHLDLRDNLILEDRWSNKFIFANQYLIKDT